MNVLVNPTLPSLQPPAAPAAPPAPLSGGEQPRVQDSFAPSTQAQLNPYPPNASLVAWARTAPVQTLPQLFRESVASHPDHPYVGAKVDGKWEFQTYRQIQDRVTTFASALVDLGLQPQERVAIIASNSPEWVVTDMGTQHAGGVLTPLFPTLSDEVVGYSLKDSGSRIVVVADDRQLQSVLANEKDLPALEHIVTLAPTQLKSATKKQWTFDELMARGAAGLDKNRPEIERRVAAEKATDIASIVYTSGTTGMPKGVLLAHGNFISNVTAVLDRLHVDQKDLELSFLPMSHVLERAVYYGLTKTGATIAYAGGPKTLAQDMKELHPSLMPGVPKVFDAIYDRVTGEIAKSPQWKQKMFHWAIRAGHDYQDQKEQGRVSPWMGIKHWLADRLVLSKIRSQTGGNVKFFLSGGAPLRPEVGDFYRSAGLPMSEGYGLTETSPVIALNPPERPRFGTVGPAVDGVEVKISPDGEIIARGPNVMAGYLNKPDATKKALDAEGFFHTEDLGQFDAAGYLQITGRTKDLLVLSNGKKVAPQPIEQKLEASPFISQSVIVGDNQTYCAALIVPKYGALETWARAQGLPTDRHFLATDARVKAMLQGEVDRVNDVLSPYERVRKIAVLENEFTEKSGELTPTLKIKRPVIKKNYAAVIDALYAESKVGA